MFKQKKVSFKLMVFAFLTLFIMLCSVFTLFINDNTAYAEETTNFETVRTHGINASAVYNIFADKHNIGTARLSTMIQLKENGEGIFLVQTQIAPFVNDGSHDYKVRDFSLNVQFASHYDDLTNISWKDNSEAPIYTTTDGVKYVINSDGTMSFAVSSEVSITSEKGTVYANKTNNALLPGEFGLNKNINIKPNEPTKDTTYNYAFAMFFKYNTKNPTFKIAIADLLDLKIDGLWFAPDYGINNSETIRISGSGDGFSQFDVNHSLVDTGKDGSPNDWLTYKSFAKKVL